MVSLIQAMHLSRNSNSNWHKQVLPLIPVSFWISLIAAFTVGASTVVIAVNFSLKALSTVGTVSPARLLAQQHPIQDVH